MCVLASDSMSEDFFFHKHNNHCETCVNIHSHILAQPNLADNAERFVTVITKSQQYFYTRLSRCHFSFTITLNVLNTNKYIQLQLNISTWHCTQTCMDIYTLSPNDNYTYKQTIKKRCSSQLGYHSFILPSLYHILLGTKTKSQNI